MGEAGPVLGALDGGDRASEDPDAVASQDPPPVKGEAAVEGRLPAEGQQDAIRTPLRDDPGDEPRLDRQQEDPVRQAG